LAEYAKGDKMSLTIQVPLTENTYQRVKQWAKAHQQDLGEAIAEYLDDTLPDTSVIPPAEPDAALLREKEAFIALHPQLKAQYYDQYVAIYEGKLIDHDANYGALVRRIDAQYPDTFVWLAKVEDEPMRELVIRSPRFLHNL
jgi:hypothetical protein